MTFDNLVKTIINKTIIIKGKKGYPRGVKRYNINDTRNGRVEIRRGRPDRYCYKQCYADPDCSFWMTYDTENNTTDGPLCYISRDYGGAKGNHVQFCKPKNKSEWDDQEGTCTKGKEGWKSNNHKCNAKTIHYGYMYVKH